MRGKKNYLLLAALLPLSLLTKANGDNGTRKSTEPVLQGCVADACTKKPVQGVTISISTSKGQEKKEFTTDASGKFNVPQMPVGEVIIILEKKGYKTYRREGIIIKEGVSLKMSFDITNIPLEGESDVFHPFFRMMEG
ncbi:MAG: carboxypeptidase-like regulatory domain-containing protein [Niastella sp.]|uniref:carboxypeptidase-like regulatory domain-containing protein n=1 Tax=Niastella sp. TaxID=1869183 RepID=UPI003899CD7B